MLLIFPILLIMLILVILFFVPHGSILVKYVERPMSNVTINNWARLVPPVIKLWWNETKGWFSRDSTLYIKLYSSYA